MSGKVTRRTFLGSTAPAIVGATTLVSRSLADGAKPNEAVRIGLIGCGGRGRHLLSIFRNQPNARIIAVCDVHRGKAEQVRSELGGNVDACQDFRRITERNDVDAVIVATTGHWHVLPAMHACAAGMDVYLEKPVGTSIGEGRAIVDAARKHKRIVQMGTQQRSWDHYRQAVEIIRSGLLGEISEVRVFDLENFWPGFGQPADCDPPEELDWEFYLGPSPKVDYNPNRYIRHYWFHDYGGGWQLDWAVHHYDIVHWAMGVEAPVAAVGAGSMVGYLEDNTEWPDTFTGACEYGPGPVARKGFLLTYSFRGACNQPIEGRHHGKVFYGSEGALALDRTGFQVFSQWRNGKKLIEEQLVKPHSEQEATTGHIQTFLECVQSHKPANTNAELGHQASNPGHLMNIAYRVGRRIRWDAAAERVIGDPEADALVTKRYREPWSLEV